MASWPNPTNAIAGFGTVPVSAGLHTIKVWLYDPTTFGDFFLRWNVGGAIVPVPEEFLFLVGQVSTDCKTIYTDWAGNQFENDKTTPYVPGIYDSECPIATKVDLSPVLGSVIQPTLNITTEDIIVGHASAFQSTGTTNIARNSTVTNTAVGQYTVSFITPHPDGADYEVLFGQDEDGADRDVVKLSVVEGSRTANGFDVQVTVDDNGAGADIYADEPWSFEVLREITVITNVTL